MTIQELKEEIIETIIDSTETEVEVTEQTHIVTEMGLSSVETMMLVSDLEDHFGITIPTATLRDVRTIGDLSAIVIDLLLED